MNIEGKTDAELRAMHTCVKAMSSMACRACNRGIPYPHPTVDEIIGGMARARGVSDLSATTVSMNKAKIVDQLVEKFRQAITRELERIWPQLVAAELLKLSGPTTYNGNKPGRKPGQGTKDKSEMIAKIKSLASEGKTQKQIAGMIGISQSYVAKLNRGERT